jgi:hypothetical protein
MQPHLRIPVSPIPFLFFSREALEACGVIVCYHNGSLISSPRSFPYIDLLEADNLSSTIS